MLTTRSSRCSGRCHRCALGTCWQMWSWWNLWCRGRWRWWSHQWCVVIRSSYGWCHVHAHKTPLLTKSYCWYRMSVRVCCQLRLLFSCAQFDRAHRCQEVALRSLSFCSIFLYCVGQPKHQKRIRHLRPGESCDVRNYDSINSSILEPSLCNSMLLCWRTDTQ